MEIAKRWRWLGIEFVVIVLGVLSALFVDTWVEDRQNEERADIYTQRLILDLERDLTNLDAISHYYKNVRDHGLMTLADLEGEQPLDDFSLMYSAFNAAEEWVFVLESSTYTDLQSTGALALIADVQLRIDLADYHRIGKTREGVWNLPREYRAIARGIIPNKLQAAIHEACNANADETPGSGVDPTADPLMLKNEPLTGSAVARGHCGLSPGDFNFAKAATELRSDPDLPHVLRYRISQLRVATALFEGQRLLAGEILERLRESG